MKKVIIKITTVLFFLFITIHSIGALGDMTYYKDIKHDTGTYSIYIRRNAQNEIDKICAMYEGTTDRIKDSQTEKEICADVLNNSRINKLLLKRIIPAEAPPGEPIVYVGVDARFRHPQEGSYFIVTPCMISETWKEDNIFSNGLDTYEKRVEVYEEVLLSAVLQDLSPENENAYLTVIEDLLSAAANSAAIPLDIKTLFDAALNGWDLSIGNGDTLKRALEYLYTFLDKYEISHLSKFKGLADKFAKNLDNIGLAVSALNFLNDLGAGIFKGMLINALALGEAELRMEVLEQWVEENITDYYLDPAISIALYHVIDAFNEYKKGTWPAFRDALFNMEMGVTFSSFFTSVGSFILTHAGSAIANCVGVGVSWVGAYAFLAINTWMAINDANHQARVVCAAATVDYLLKRKIPLQDSTIRKNSRIVSIRNYLAYYYFLKTYELNTDSLLAWLLWYKMGPWNDELLIYMDIQKENFCELLPPFYMSQEEVPGFLAKIDGPMDTLEPYVKNSWFENKPDTNIILTFSEPMESTLFTSNKIVLTGSANGNLTYSFHYNDEDNSLTINPDNNVGYDEIITLVLDSSVTDLAGHPMAAPFSLSFSISSPYQPPSFLVIPSLQIIPDHVDPLEPYTLTGYVENDHGDELSAGTVEISMDGQIIGTTSVHNGSFQIRLNAPAHDSLFPVNKNVVVNIFDGQIATLDPQDFIVLTVNGLAPKNGYDFVSLKTYAGFENNTPINETTRFPREINSKVYVALDLEHLMVSCSIQFQFIRPDGTFYEEHIVPIDPNVVGESHLVVFVRNLGMGEYGLLGDWTCKVIVTPAGGEPEHVDSISYTVGYNLQGHQLCESVSGTPLEPVNPGNLFTTNMEQLYSFINFTDLSEVLHLMWSFKGPHDYEKKILQTTNDPGVSGIATYGVSAALSIAGTEVEYMCGDWSVELYVMTPDNDYSLAGVDYFTLLENPSIPPEISVSMESEESIENQDIYIKVSVTDNNYIDKVVLHWKSGYSLYRTWNSVGTGDFEVIHSIGTMFEQGDVVEYWVEAWDLSGNYTHSFHQFINIQQESISPPHPPVTVGAIQRDVPITVTTQGASSNCGSALEYQYDWGDGNLSPWGTAVREHSYNKEGEFPLKVKARSTVNIARESEWSGIFFIKVDSTPPVINIITNAGNTISSNDNTIIIEGTAIDPESGSGIASTTNSLDAFNEGSKENWRFSFTREEEFAEYHITAEDNAGNISSVDINVEPGPEIEIFPESLTFPLTEVGGFSETQFIIKNTGYGEYIGNVTVLPPFSVLDGDTIQLSHNEEQLIIVRFSPESQEEYNGNLDLSGPIALMIPLYGKGSDSPILTLESAELDFGVVETGSFRDLFLTITNSGFGLLSGSIEVEQPFSIAPSEDSYALLHNETAAIPIRFEPMDEGFYMYDLNLAGEGSNDCILKGMGSREPVFYNFVNGDGNPSSHVNALYMIRNYNYQYADNEQLIVGKGESSQFIETWLQYPNLFNFSGNGIPYNARISFGTLLFHVRDFRLQGVTPLNISLYRIKDPSHLGKPIYPDSSGFVKGIDYYYRDNRIGRKIPWIEPNGSMTDLITGYEPTATVCLNKDYFEKYDDATVAFDVTKDLKAWLNGEENHGWFLQCSATTEAGDIIEFFSPTSINEDQRPELLISYDTNNSVIPPEAVTVFDGICDDSEVILEWDFPETDFTGVRIIRKEGSAPLHPYDGNLVIDTVIETSYTDKNLENGTEYFYNLYLYNGTLNFSPCITRKLVPGAPNPPELLPSLIGPGYVILKWNPVSNADFYRIYRIEKDSGKKIVIGNVKGEYFQDENIGLSGYFYEIHACNNYGEGPGFILEIEDIPCSLEYPKAPEITAIRFTEDFQIVLEWLSLGTRESGYILERSVSGGLWKTLCELDFISRSFTDKELTPDTHVEYRIYSKNSLGQSLDFDIVSIDIIDFPGKPKNFRYNFVNSTLLKMIWEQPIENITEYRVVQYNSEGTPVFTDSISGDSRSYYLNSIVPEDLFYYSLTALNNQGEQTLITEYIVSKPGIKQDLPYEYTPPLIVPSIPLGLTVLPRSSKSFIINWSPVPGSIYYELYRSNIEEGEYTLVYQGKETYFYDTGRTPSTPYYFRIAAAYTDAHSPLSQPVVGVTEAQPSFPLIPRNFTIYREDLSTISMVWDSIRNASTYKVFRSENPASAQWALVYTGTFTSFTDTNLSPGSRHFYQVHGINSAGSGPFSKIIIGTTKNRPFSPYINQINTLGIDALEIIWDSYGIVEGFHLYRAQSLYGPYDLVYQGEEKKFVDTGLIQDSVYYYKVIAVNSYGSSVDSFPVSGNTGVIPNPPNNLRIETNSLSTISLRWDDSENTESYTLYRSLSAETDYTAIYTGTFSFFEDTGLPAGTTYYYRVQGMSSFGSSELSSCIEAQTGALLTSPLELTIEQGDTTFSLTISWEQIESAVSYALYFSDNSDGDFQLLNESAETYFIHDSLLSNTHYYYKVASINEFGIGPLSETETGLTGSLPSLPSGFTISDESVNSITISWNAASFSTSYSVYRDTNESGSFTTEVFSGPELTYIDTFLNPHQTYYYKIVSQNRYGESIISDWISGTTLSITYIAATARNSYAILDNGSVWGWGANNRGQLGDGTTVSSSTPVLLPVLSNIKKIVGGTEYNNYALTNDGLVFAWGDNSDGFLGLGNKINSYMPTQIPQLTTIQDISAGETHVLALDSNGVIWAWGANESGEIGNGTTNEYLSPIQLTGLPVMTQISAGDEFSLALDNNGNVWGWGRTSNGRSGLGHDTVSPYYETRPLQLAGLSNITQIHCGALHGLALRNDGTLFIWGDNQFGQQGNGLRDEEIPLQYINYQPVQVPGLNNVTEIIKGFSLSDRTTIRKNDSTIWGWGFNVIGAGVIGTGDDQIECYLEPIQAAVVPQDILDIATGDIHTLFITSENKLMSWGSNSYGRLGDGTSQNQAHPVEVEW
ncbi:MAG: Ig-like domain-containing protein [Spirochaetales bacterium]|nr:Ig-like domain-containing protein [Spirochaetales bacterium]